jgi:uncharacterized protein YndB with AHSA1/START domain
MSGRSAVHGDFTIERVYDAQPARVFAAWTSVEAKAVWNFCDESWRPTLHEIDFRVGGRERIRTGPAGGTVHAFDGTFHDIVPDQRIVFSYDMRLDQRLISVSLVTITVAPAAKRTRLRFTEQGVFLDGYDDIAGREEGTRIGLDNLDVALRRALAA